MKIETQINLYYAHLRVEKKNMDTNTLDKSDECRSVKIYLSVLQS